MLHRFLLGDQLFLQSEAGCRVRNDRQPVFRNGADTSFFRTDFFLRASGSSCGDL